MIWPSVIQTILIGTDRRSLPEESAAALGVPAAQEPVQVALEALATAALLRKAGLEPLPAAVSEVPEAAPDESEKPLLPEAALRHLRRMLGGSYPEGLPEFIRLAIAHGYRFPPESLPDMLDECLKNAETAILLAPALGARGQWLARQNERWKPWAALEEEEDWFTLPFSGRKRLLENTRRRNPLLGLSWLEKTWSEEKAEHKVPFLEILKIRLSSLDQDLLERALEDKNREVRLAALECLALLPESAGLAALRSFFSEHFSGALAPDKREKYLQASLPDLSDAALKPWFELLSKKEKADWRNGLFQLMLRYLPPADLLQETRSSPAELLAALDGGNQTAGSEALLHNLLERQESEPWVAEVWRYYGKNFRHSLWQTPAMQAWMKRHIESLLQFLEAKKHPLDYDNQFILRVLEQHTQPWSRALLQHLLQQYRRALSNNMPGWHYSMVLQVAAWHCALPDGLVFFDASAGGPGAYQPREWVAFQNILYFRKQVQATFFAPEPPIQP